MSTEVRDNPESQRFEVVVDGTVAGFADYRLDGRRIAFTHTEVSDGYEGQGLAKQLVVHALDSAARRELEVVPLCSYVARTIAKQPDRYLALVPEDARDRLPADGA